jgi:hypothetical protein
MDGTLTRLCCEECARLSAGAASGWRTYLAPDPDDPAEQMLATYCPACAEREFGSTSDSAARLGRSHPG